MKNSIFLAGSILTLLVVLLPNAYATTDKQIDCDEIGDHSWCNGGRGRDGLPFCDVEAGKSRSCYDRNDNREDYCKHYGESDKKFCEGVGCSVAGFDDGQNGSFSQEKHEGCNDDYYNRFIRGCENAGNSKETCESFTDD